MNKSKVGPIHIVVVDDSATARELLLGIFRSSPDIQVVGTGFNGMDAISLVNRLHPDVVILDINMPKMDGLEATKRIMREAPTPIVLITSRLPVDLDLSFKALRAGALTVIDKPALNDLETCRKIVQTVKLLAGVPVIHHWRTRDATREPSQSVEKQQPFEVDDSSLNERLADIQIIGIATSTGGPAALVTVLNGLPKEFPLPILAVQHITEGFAEGLATWLNMQLRLDVCIATNGEKLRAGVLYLPPDDHHLMISARKTVQLSKDPPYKGLRPSANYLFESLARVYGKQTMGIILTGMGDDGVQGAVSIYNRGGLIVAQDEQSSVVYGMPREVKMRSAVNQVLNLEQIAMLLNRFAYAGDKPVQAGMRG